MALTTGLTHLFSMTSASSESNVAPFPAAPLSLTETSPAPDLDAGPAPPDGSSFRSFQTVDRFLTAPSGDIVIAPGAGPIDYTVAAWVRFDSLNGSQFSNRHQVIASEGSGGVDTQSHWRLFADGTTDKAAVSVNQSDDTFVEQQGDTFGVLSLSTWYLVVGLFNGTGGTLGLSVNAGTIDTSVWDGSIDDNTTTQLIMSHFNNFNSGALSGDISEFAAWNRVLTSGEITAYWNGGSGASILGGAGGSAFLRRRRRSP